MQLTYLQWVTNNVRLHARGWPQQVQDYKFIHVCPKDGKPADTLAMLQEFRKACGDPAWITEVEWQGDTEMALEVGGRTYDLQPTTPGSPMHPKDQTLNG